MLKLVKHPDSLLSNLCSNVSIDTDFLAWAKEVEEWCDNPPPEYGTLVGMAANQLGKSWRAFILRNEEIRPTIRDGIYRYHYEWYINPKIIWITKAPKNLCKEGCYSLTAGDFTFEVSRAPSISLEWIDINGVQHQKRFNGFKAQVIQHEIDHLNGITVNSYGTDTKS